VAAGIRLLGFVEGARCDTGGIGLIGVPLIHKAFAGRGHQDVLAIGGRPMPSAVPFLVADPEEVFGKNDGGVMGVVSYPALGRWALSPSLAASLSRHVRAVDFVTLHSLFSFPVLAGYVLARRHRKPYGLWPHGVFAPVQRRVSRRKKAVYSGLLARKVLGSASVLFYSARGEREEAARLCLSTPSVVIPHGIETSAYAALPTRGEFRRKYLQGHQGPLVLYLGRLNGKKGLDLLIQAIAQSSQAVPSVRLVIVGGAHPPAFGGRVVEWIRQHGIDSRTVLTGPLDEQEKLKAFADADVFVLPSEAENFGFAMFEAMASRLPVVISNTLNYANEVQRHDAGIAVPREASGFAAAITALLTDPGRRRQLGENGARLAAEYSWERCGERVETAVRCILSREPFPKDLDPV